MGGGSSGRMPTEVAWTSSVQVARVARNAGVSSMATTLTGSKDENQTAIHTRKDENQTAIHTRKIA